jgi:hypothetical protein
MINMEVMAEMNRRDSTSFSPYLRGIFILFRSIREGQTHQRVKALAYMLYIETLSKIEST